MFRRSADRLSFLQIAKLWAREIQPSASLDELVDELESAWWRGEIVGNSAKTRLQFLQTMFGFRKNLGIAFVTPTEPGPPDFTELENGGVKVDISPRIIVPCETEPWTDESCAIAFETLANSPSRENFPLLSISLHFIELTGEEFFGWIEKRGFDVPTFWKRDSAAIVSAYQTASPGRPSSRQLVEAELDLRIANKSRCGNVTTEAESLADWLKLTHPKSPRMTGKTILNRFRSKIREHVNAGK
jgi:hypothetical protein